MTDEIALKRVYQPTTPDDGARVLVDRLWPRGKGRDSLSLQDWYFEASPSPALLKTVPSLWRVPAPATR